MSSIAILAIRAAIRIGSTAADAFDQYAQEKPILLPDTERSKGNVGNFIAQMAIDFPEFARMLTEDPELKVLWVNDRPVSVEAGLVLEAVAYQFARRAAPQSGAGPNVSEERVYGVMVTQWATGKGPVSPFARVVVAMADVALEYIAGNPQTLGIGGDGEKLVGAIAGAISSAIPDATTRTALGPKDRFAERLAALTLHAGLKVLSETPELVLDETHLQVLLQNTLEPVISELDTGSIANQVEWQRVTDAMLGASVSAALRTVSENPSAYLGNKYNSERAAGLMVSGLLRAAADSDLQTLFSDEGLKRLGRAAIEVAADHPAVVLGDLLDTDLTTDLSSKNTLALGMFSSIADTLRERKSPYRNELGTAVAIAALQGLKQSAPTLIRNHGDWNDVIAGVTTQVLDGFVEALGDDARGIKDTVFSEAALIEVARTVLDQVGRAPHLLAGDKPEVRRIVSALCQAMVADEKLLLTADDWTRIVAVAAEEAAINPGRLFGFDQQSMEGQLATDIIRRILKAAANGIDNPGRKGGPIMTGTILRETIIVTLRAISGNVQQAFERREMIGQLADKLDAAIATRGMQLGGKELLRIFRRVLPDVLNGGELPEFDDATLAALLA